MQGTRLTLICHALTPYQKRGRFPADESVLMDWENAPLSQAARFKKDPRLLCGPEARTRQTATLFATTAVMEPALRDGDFGAWQGQALSDVDPLQLHTWLTDPSSAPHGGESVDEICERVGRWMHTLQTQPGHVVAVTHPFVIRAALLYVMKFPLSMFYLIDVEPLSSTELRYHHAWRLRLETHA